jgi:hypothetical protein
MHDVPGHLFVATDYNATQYLIGTTPATMQWLTAAGRSQLDLDKTWSIFLDLIEPTML